MSSENQTNQAFYEEANDLLPELESSLLELEEHPQDFELINRVFRALHTLKGSGSMFGFDSIAEFTHEVETVFDLLRNGDLEVCKELLDLTFAAKDQIECMLHSPDTADVEEIQRIVGQMRRFLPSQGPAPAGTSAPEKDMACGLQEMEKVAGECIIYRIRFKPARHIFATGTNPLHLLDELRELGECYVLAHVDSIPQLDELDPEQCSIWWDIILSTCHGENAIQDVFIFVEDEAELLIQVIDEGGEIEGDDPVYKRLGEILLERGDVREEELNAVLREKKPIGKMLADTGVVSEQAVQAALAEQTAVREARTKRKEQDTVSSLRVPAAKLDQLVDLVGELVIAQARLSQLADERSDQDLSGIAEEIERLSDELRDGTLGIRMLPIGSTFSRFQRVVRDLTSEMGKEIELVTDGAETELDKTVIERLNDPLMHLLRNSIDHGIEPPEKREQAGKPRQGTVTLSARHSGGSVLISIEDDGKGLDPEALRAKAIEKGVVAESAALSDKELFQLIFAPGFSTATEVTDVSGRGVGMDVVKSNIEALRGSIEVESRKGEGTLVTVKLPLTLAIIDGLQVRIQQEYYIIPLPAVSECVELTAQDKAQAKGGRFIPLREQLVPYIRLQDWFAIQGEPPSIEQVVIVSADDNPVGLVVDEVIGQQQTVIKNLGRMYRNVQGISGATIKGDGSMALIIDVEPLLREVQAQESQRVQ